MVCQDSLRRVTLIMTITKVIYNNNKFKLPNQRSELRKPPETPYVDCEWALLAKKRQHATFQKVSILRTNGQNPMLKDNATVRFHERAKNERNDKD